MKIRILIFFSFLFIYSSCDMLATDEDKLVGNISIINPHTQSDNGYSLIIYEEEINKNILNNYIVEVIGDDTVLLAKCKNENDDFIYYKISHNKGNKVTGTFVIDTKEYAKLKETLKIKYSFYDSQ